MVDVYDCPDLVIRGCRFASNTRSDDTVNLAQSTFLVEDCLFEHANADSLDLDMSRGIVRRCLFRDGGNDGLDMMTCRVHAYDCRFERLGDKGFSIGEASRFLADDCVIDHCERGAAFKDGSTAVLRHVQAIGCNSGIDAYQKKATYGRAGHGLLIDCKVEQSAKFDFAIEKRGRVELLRTPRTHVDDHADQDIDRPVGMNTPAALAKKAAKKGATAEKEAESEAEVAADPSATPALADRKVLADRKHAEAPTAPKGTSADRVVMVERIAPEFAAVIRELEPEPRR
jgi:hypothetical protein